ncbi:MAG: hypothetical protein JWN41_663, partial [Thermoleophilia bacterium]|nr:hypothetical protein [Thermoleophilia bacterium]
MKTERTEGAHEPNNRRQKQAPPGKPRRRGAAGPLGFGSVMRDVS